MEGMQPCTCAHIEPQRGSVQRKWGLGVDRRCREVEERQLCSVLTSNLNEDLGEGLRQVRGFRKGGPERSQGKETGAMSEELKGVGLDGDAGAVRGEEGEGRRRCGAKGEAPSTSMHLPHK